jgi:hypothetical protein
MSQPAVHDVQKQIGDGAASAVAHPRRAFSVFGSSNTLVSAAQLRQSADILIRDTDIPPTLTLVEVKPTMIAVAPITWVSSISFSTQASSISFSTQAASISFSGQDKMLTPIREDLGERVKARRTGPVQVLSKIANDWQLSRTGRSSRILEQSECSGFVGRAS